MHSEKRRPAWIHVLACLVLWLGAAILFSYGRNEEFCGQDDHIIVQRFVSYTTFPLAPNEWTARGCYHHGIATLKLAFLDAPHGPLPTAYYGLFYRIWDALGLPFSVKVFHLPIALFGAGACVLMYLVLVQHRFSVWASVGGAGLLMFSPLYTMECRGIATFNIAAVPFMTLLALLALGALPRRRCAAWLVGLALAQAVLSDVLFFLTLAALLAAFVLRRGFGRMRRSARSLLQWGVWLPPVVCVVAVLGATAYAVWLTDAASLGFMPKTPILRLLNHSKDAGSMLLEDPRALHDYGAMILGEAFPLLFLGLIFFHIFVVRKWPRGVPGAFGVIAGVGFALLFYVLTARNEMIRNHYQAYLLVPYVLLVMFLGRDVLRRCPRLKPIAPIFVALLLVSGVLGTACAVWKKALAVRRATFTSYLHGVNMPSSGAEATGYILRRVLAANRDSVALDGVQLRFSRHIEQHESLYVFGGLGEAWLLGKVALDMPAEPVNEKTPTPVDVSVRLGKGHKASERPPEFRYTVVDGPSHVCMIEVAGGIVPEGLSPGIYERCELERRFRRRYSHLADFFPDVAR